MMRALCSPVRQCACVLTSRNCHEVMRFRKVVSAPAMLQWIGDSDSDEEGRCDAMYDAMDAMDINYSRW